VDLPEAYQHALRSRIGERARQADHALSLDFLAQPALAAGETTRSAFRRICSMISHTCSSRYPFRRPLAQSFGLTEEQPRTQRHLAVQPAMTGEIRMSASPHSCLTTVLVASSPAFRRTGPHPYRRGSHQNRRQTGVRGSRHPAFRLSCWLDSQMPLSSGLLLSQPKLWASGRRKG